jgi:hypothetical protein
LPERARPPHGDVVLDVNAVRKEFGGLVARGGDRSGDSGIFGRGRGDQRVGRGRGAGGKEAGRGEQQRSKQSLGLSRIAN